MLLGALFTSATSMAANSGYVSKASEEDPSLQKGILPLQSFDVEKKKAAAVLREENTVLHRAGTAAVLQSSFRHPGQIFLSLPADSGKL